MYRPGTIRLLLIGHLALLAHIGSGQIAVNNTAIAPNGKAMLDLSDATRGLLLPRMTRADRIALAGANSLLVYQTDDYVPAVPGPPEPKGLWYRDGANPSW